MASKPLTRQAHAKIAAAGGEAFILSEVSSGRTLKDIAEELGITRPILSAWCNAPARKDAYSHARREAASALIEEGLNIADSVSDPSEVPAAKLRSDFRRWMASRLNPDSWGEQQRAPNVAIQINGLHLESLRQLHVIRGEDSADEG